MNDDMQDKLICPYQEQQGLAGQGFHYQGPIPAPGEAVGHIWRRWPGPTKSPGKFVETRQVEDETVKKIHKLESVSAGSLARHGHGCDISGRQHTYNTELIWVT